MKFGCGGMEGLANLGDGLVRRGGGLAVKISKNGGGLPADRSSFAGEPYRAEIKVKGVCVCVFFAKLVFFKVFGGFGLLLEMATTSGI